MSAALLILAAGLQATTPSWVVDQEVIATHRVAPEYPYWPAAAGATAICRSIFDTDAQGAPINLCVRCSMQTEADVPDYVARRFSAEFVQSAEVALGQWRYSDPHRNAQGLTTTINYHLADQTDADLPEPPAMGECLGPQIS